MDQVFLNEMMGLFAAKAPMLAGLEYFQAIDYTVDSMTAVEARIAEIHDSIPKNKVQRLFKKGPSEEAIQELAKTFGAYIGETFRQVAGGEWRQFEDGSLGIETATLVFFPLNKVYKRLVNGPEDNLRSYFLVLLNRAKSAEDRVGANV